VRYVTDTDPVWGGNVRAQWKHRLANESVFNLRGYVDRHSRRSTIRRTEIADTIDIEAQHRVRLFEQNNVVYGGGARWIRMSGTWNQMDEWFTRLEDQRSQASAFVQDEIDLVPRRLRATLGSKFEYNTVSGFNAQPSARLLWTPSRHNSVWGSVARAVRTPSYMEQYNRINLTVFPSATGTLTELLLIGNPQVGDEELIAYEAGYRVDVLRQLSVDVAAYYNDYDRLQSSDIATPYFVADPAPHLVVPNVIRNVNEGETRGIETFATWKPVRQWTVRGGYTWYAFDVRRTHDGAGRDPAFFAANTPSSQVQAQSLLTLHNAWDVDVTAYLAGAAIRGTVPGYTRLDTRLAWRASDRLELSLVGQNLLDARHVEFAGDATGVIKTVARRAAYVKARWTF
jgi:iron complex outermembrane receptor protein